MSLKFKDQLSYNVYLIVKAILYNILRISIPILFAYNTQYNVVDFINISSWYFQNIIVYEWLPLLLGESLPPYTGKQV